MQIEPEGMKAMRSMVGQGEGYQWGRTVQTDERGMGDLGPRKRLHREAGTRRRKDTLWKSDV